MVILKVNFIFKNKKEYSIIMKRVLVGLTRFQEMDRMNDQPNSVCGYNLYAIPEGKHQYAHIHLRKGEGDVSYATFDFKGNVMTQRKLNPHKTTEIISWIKSHHNEIITNWRGKVIKQNPK